MGKIKSFIRKKLITVIEFSFREEIKNNDYFVNGDKRTDKQIERWTWDRFKRTDMQIEKWTWDRFKRTDKQIEKWTWDRFKRTQKILEEDIHRIESFQKLIPYHKGEKIRLVILFQIPSCWAAIASFYKQVVEDERFDVTLLLYDAIQKEKAQMAGAREFLDELDVKYEDAEQYDFRFNRPHIMLYQTPWDEAHRPAFLQSLEIASMGTRIAYIPYGINYSASVWDDFVFSDLKFKAKPWFIAGLSEKLKMDHQYLSKNCGHNVVVTGLPKFDLLYDNRDKLKSKKLIKLAKGRKIIFIQMHFPDKEGNAAIPEPCISEYIEFLQNASKYRKLFFVVRPHPKYYEAYENLGFMEAVDNLKQIISDTENICIDEEKDYMPALTVADYYIGDRSALMIEAAVLGIPVLYMTNFYYKETMLPYVEGLVESFYQGEKAYDIERFIDMVVINGQDYKKTHRMEEVKKSIPYFDGLCGKRIVDKMADLINIESED